MYGYYLQKFREALVTVPFIAKIQILPLTTIPEVLGDDLKLGPPSQPPVFPLRELSEFASPRSGARHGAPNQGCRAMQANISIHVASSRSAFSTFRFLAGGFTGALAMLAISIGLGMADLTARTELDPSG